MSTKISSALSSLCRFLVVALLTIGLTGISPLQAQNPTPSRITAPLDEHAVFTLRGHVHPLARREFDRGAAPVSLPAERMLLLLKRGPEQQQALDKYLSALQDPSSSSYHKFTTPQEFGRLYGPSDADIQTISNWLQSRGFQINHVSQGRTTLEFSGNVGQVQDAFRTSIHSFMVRGEQHWANTTDPSIPAALAPAIAGLSPLNNFTARPNSLRGPSAIYDIRTRKATPLLTSTTGGNFLYVGPADAATIYNTPSSSLNANYAATQAYDGSGITIAIAGVSQINTADVDHYRSIFGLSVNTPQIIVDGNDPGHNGAEDEALLDLEIAGALAPGAKTVLYTAASTTLQDGLFLAIARALQDNTASILNVSFGNCEAAFGSSAASGNPYISSLWEQAAAQGISVTVSSGDSGSAGCDDANSVTVASKGLGVNALASTPYNIAVGGTDYPDLTTNFLTYATVVNRLGTRGSALKYIPESPWNDSTNVNGALAQNTPQVDKSGNKNIVGAGGGVSTVYPKPAWQTKVTPQDGARDLPDVSLLAANGLDAATWAVCASQFVNAQGVTVTDCVPDPTTNTYSLSGFGGTSTAAPAFAGMLAMVQQSVGHRLGQANVVLYKLSQTAPSVFHDITSGNISVVCIGGTTANCGSNSFLTGYDAGPGYDLASGLGSVDATAMIKNWAGAGLSASTTTLALGSNQTTFVHGTPITINVGVSGSGGTPTGDVGLASTNPDPNAGGLGFLTLGAAGTASTTSSFFPGGTYSVAANYGGDTTYAGSVSSPTTITITPEASILQLTAQTIVGSNLVSVANTSIPFGTYVSIDAIPMGVSQQGQASFTPLGSGQLTTVTDNGTVLASMVSLNSNGGAEVPIYSYPAGPHSISAFYSGDASYLQSSAGPIAFTVTDALLTATPTALILTAGQSKPLTLNLAPSNGFAGIVNLSCAITAGPANAQSVPTCGIAPAAITINGTATAAATLTVTTTATKTAAVRYPGWIAGGSGAVMACLLFFGIPARRRNWRAIPALLFFISLAATGCGGGGGGGGGGGVTTPGTTPGSYTVTVQSSTNTTVMHQLAIIVTVN